MGRERIYNATEITPQRKDLRNSPTDAEIVLWARLQRKQLNGKKFRRQASIGPYIVDFYCPEYRVIVELDGAGHHTEDGAKHDERRTEYLEKRGLRVLRFENKEVLENLRDVLQTILLVLERPPRLRHQRSRFIFLMRSHPCYVDFVKP